MEITKEYIEKYKASWESRHDEWVRDYLAPLLQTNKKTMRGIKPILKEKLDEDWRFSLAFFIDRTTYQSRKDIVNIRTATYLFKKIIALPKKFDAQVIKEMINSISRDKENNLVTHIRVKTDIERLAAVCNFLISA